MLTALTLVSGGLTRNERIGVLLPVPFYPVYLALLSTLGLMPIPYYLNEEKGWAMPSQDEFSAIIRESKASGITPRCIIVINPSNPTGAVYSELDLETVIRLAAEERLLLLADEVYQENILPPAKFKSCKSALRSLQASYATNPNFSTLQLISLHSVSKGMIGEGGQRGGYFEATGFSPFCMQQIQKLVTYTLQPCTAGQILVECMVNPPKPNEPSYAQYRREYDSIYERLRDKAESLYDAFQRMPGVKCQAPQGAIYEFPQIQLPPAAVTAAKASGEAPDTWYCLELLKSTGICVVPGSGFGMGDGAADGKIWFRVAFLGDGKEWIARLERFQINFATNFSAINHCI
jgi:alanine transaminase